MSADIRSYGWDKPTHGVFEPEVSYLCAFSRSGGPSSIARSEGSTADYVRPGAVMFLPAQAQFRIRSNPGTHKTLCVKLSAAAADRVLAAEGGWRGRWNEDLDLRDPGVDRCLSRLRQEVQEPGFASAALVESVMVTLLVELCRHFRPGNGGTAVAETSLAGWRVRRIKEKIEANLADVLTIEALAAEVGMSRRHLIRTFKNSEGITLAAYIAQARLRHAKQRLNEGHLLLKQIAAECGFASSTAFSNAFRSAVGHSPKEFRSRNW